MEKWTLPTGEQVTAIYRGDMLIGFAVEDARGFYTPFAPLVVNGRGNQMEKVQDELEALYLAGLEKRGGK